MDRFNQPLVTAFAAALRDLREEAGITQEELAGRAEVSARFVSLLETGRRKPSLSALAALSSGLDLPMAQLAGAIEERLKRTGDSGQG